MSLNFKALLSDGSAVTPFARFTQTLARWIAPSEHFFVKPLLLGLLLALVNFVINIRLSLIIRATGVGASRQSLVTGENDPVLFFMLIAFVGPALETLAMVLLYELLRVLLRRNTLFIGLSIAVAPVWAHDPRGLLAISIALAFGLFAYEYGVYRRIFGVAGGSSAVFLTHATNNAAGAILIITLTRWTVE